MQFNTLLLHGKSVAHNAHGEILPPISQVSAFQYESMEDLEKVFQHKRWGLPIRASEILRREPWNKSFVRWTAASGRFVPAVEWQPSPQRFLRSVKAEMRSLSGVELGGITTFIGSGEESDMSLFI